MRAILLYEGCAAHEATGALAAWRAADLDADLVAWEPLVRSREGVRLVPHALDLDLLTTADVLAIPGGDTTAPLRHAPLARALRARRGKWTLAAGAGISLAAASGLAEGRRVSAYPGEAPIPGTDATNARLVADGRLLTCHGGDAIVDLVLHHVAHTAGAPAARRAADALRREYQPFALGATPP